MTWTTTESIITNPVLTCEVMDEVNRCLPMVAEFLDCEVKDLVVLTYYEQSYETSIYRDRLVTEKRWSPLLDNVEYKFGRNHRKNSSIPGVGIITYNAETFQHCKICVAITGGNSTCYETVRVMKRTDLYKWSRRVKKNNAIIQKNGRIKPILDSVLFQNILDNSIGFLKNSRALKKYGTTLKRGLLLLGLPGNGKTMLCRYLSSMASQNGILTTSYSSSQLLDVYNKGNLETVLNFSGIVFFDDIDISFFSKSRANGSLGCSLLSAMDGMDASNNTVRIFSTNENTEAMDPAFTRPGRIDISFNFTNPNEALRLQFIDTWDKDMKKHIDTSKLVKDTEGWSFAEINYVKNIMAEEFILRGKWNIDSAISQVSNRLNNNEYKQKKVGFK